MLKKLVSFKNFQKKFFNNRDKKKILKFLIEILNENPETIKSLSLDYKNSYKKDILIKFKKKFSNFRSTINCSWFNFISVTLHELFNILLFRIKQIWYRVNNKHSGKHLEGVELKC